MCDLHLAIYMLMYVYVDYPSNVAAKSWLAPGYSWHPGCLGGHQNRRHVSNRVRLLVVPQWPQMAIKSVTH
jgi:hypothetical protein